jgi:hypothetical protein
MQEAGEVALPVMDVIRLVCDYNALCPQEDRERFTYIEALSLYAEVYDTEPVIGSEVILFEPDEGTELVGRITKVYPSPWTGNMLIDIAGEYNSFRETREEGAPERTPSSR